MSTTKPRVSVSSNIDALPMGSHLNANLHIVTPRVEIKVSYDFGDGESALEALHTVYSDVYAQINTTIVD